MQDEGDAGMKFGVKRRSSPLPVVAQDEERKEGRTRFE